MTNDVISDELQRFILRHIDSITQLEGLLLLHANPDKAWDVASVTKRLYASERDVEAALNRLCTGRLLSCSAGIYCYDPESPENRALVDQLVATYSRHLIPVTNLIHSKVRDIRDFADAFRFRKGD